MRKTLALASIGLLLVCTGGWISVQRTPRVVSETSRGPWLEQDVSLGYTINLEAGTLYPEGMTLDETSRSVIPTRLLGSGTVRLTDVVSYGDGRLASGHFQASLAVRAGNLWSKEYPLSGLLPFEPAAAEIQAGMGSTRADLSFAFPLAAIQSDIDRIEEEIGLSSPSGGYEIDIRLYTEIELEPIGRGPSLVRTFQPVFTFFLERGGLTLEPPPELTATDDYVREVTTTRPGTVAFLGNSWTWDRARRTATAGLGLSLLLALAAGAWWYGASPRTRDRRDPARALGGRTVRVTGVGGFSLNLSLRVAGLKELARLADDAQVPILEVGPDIAGLPEEPAGEPDPRLEGRRFLAVVGDTLYYVA